jgi:hypothetical protein
MMGRHSSISLVKGANKINLKPPATITADYDIVLPAALPAATQGVQRSSAGQESYFTPVTSLALSTEANAFLAASTTTGALNLDLDTQTANLVFAAPSTGLAAKPTFRNLVTADFGATPPRLNEWSVPNASLSLNNQKITLLADPTTGTDGANKAYVDALVQGFVVKIARVATTANITLSGTQTIDTIVLAAGDRVLVKNQTLGAENGIWVVAAGAWTRATDLDAQSELIASMLVLVQQGALNNDTSWLLSTDGTLVLGTTPLTFIQFNGLAQVIDGAGLTKTGNQLDVGGTAGRIVVNANDIDLATTAIAAGTYNSLTVDTYGRATGGTNQPYVKVFRTAFTNATLVAGILTVTHNLGQQFCQVQVWDNNNKLIDADDYTATSGTVVTIDLTNYGAIAGTWNVIVTG